jgi:hypothetical protein
MSKPDQIEPTTLDAAAICQKLNEIADQLDHLKSIVACGLRVTVRDPRDLSAIYCIEVEVSA